MNYNFILIIILVSLFAFVDIAASSDLTLVGEQADGRSLYIARDTLVRIDNDMAVMVAVTNYPNGFPSKKEVHSIIGQMYIDCGRSGGLSIGFIMGTTLAMGEGEIILKKPASDKGGWREFPPDTPGYILWAIGCGL